MTFGVLTYSTIFRSRLGLLNLALDCSERSYALRASLRRNLENKLKGVKTVSTGDPEWAPLVKYLIEKGFISKSKSAKSKYKLRYEADEVGNIELFDVKGARITQSEFAISDLWLSDRNIRSTIGAPTVENVDEVLDFATQVGVISATKGNWTSSGKLAVDLWARRATADQDRNPFILGPEVIVYVRTLFQLDGLLLRALASLIGTIGGSFKRDEVITYFGRVMDEVGGIVKGFVRDKAVLKDYAEFDDLVQKNMRKRENRKEGETINLGVLEHRVSPRLEWLTDLRVLDKQEKNVFAYTTDSDFAVFAEAIQDLGVTEESRDDAAISFLTRSSWAKQELGHLVETEPYRAVMKSYALVRPPVGPARIDDASFIAALLSRDETHTMAFWREYIVGLAREHDGITVSGDRFHRTPRMVHVKEGLWRS